MPPMPEQTLMSPKDPVSTLPPKKPKRRKLRIVIASLLSVVLIAVLGVFGYAAYLEHVVNSSLTHSSLLPEENGAKPGPTKAPEAGNALNILLLGSDLRPGEGQGRSDVMLLLHIDRARQNITMIHLPRDMQVSIPGHRDDKLNASYAYGGAPLTVTTVQNMLGVRIDHVAQIGFEGFKAMTDAVGGVDVHVAEGSREFPVGQTHLNGERALLFVRQRYELPEGDISRGRRELAFVKGLMMKALSPQTMADPRKLTSFVEAAAKNATVDKGITTEMIRSLAFELRSVRGNNIHFLTAPISGFATRPDGAAINIVDTAAMKRLGHALSVDDMASYRR